MEALNIVVIGLGSMGKRRTRIIRQLFPEFKVAGIDLQEERRQEFAREFSLPVYATLEEAQEVMSLEAAIISTSPLSHGVIAGKCLSAGLHVFTEINLQPYHYAENIQLAEKKHLQLFLSSTFLYRNEVEFITNKVKYNNEPMAYIYHVGQYLSDWHPWEDYRNFFVAKKDSNACRELFAIELPWLTNAFGEIESIQVVSDKMTKLELPYHDNYMVIIRHKSGHKGMLAVDVVSREAVRDFCAYGENLYIKWDGTPNGLQEKDLLTKELKLIALYKGDTVRHSADYSRNIIENAYENELRAFVAAIFENKKPVYGYEEDMQTLNWIDEIEKGMAK